MRSFALLLLLALSAPALAQWPGKAQGPQRPAPGRWSAPQQNLSHEERQRLRDDVNSARGTYDARAEPRPQGRLAPEERERLRRDVQDANREMGRR